MVSWAGACPWGLLGPFRLWMGVCGRCLCLVGVFRLGVTGAGCLVVLVAFKARLVDMFSDLI